MSVRVFVDGVVVLEAPDGSVVTAPTEAVVIVGVGSVNALKNAGVPNVSVSAIPSTYYAVSIIITASAGAHTPSPKQDSQYFSASSLAFS